MVKKISVLIVFLFLFLCSPSLAFAEVVFLAPTQDATIDSNRPFDCQEAPFFLNLYYISDPFKKMEVLIQFDLSSIPSNATINSAWLRLYMSRMEGVSEAKVDIWRNLASWNEGGANCVKWDNKPNISSTGVSVVCHSFIGYKDWNVTNIVKNWLSNTYPNYGLRLIGPSSGNYVLNFYSTDDHLQTNKPQLEIDYTVPIDLNINLNPNLINNLFTSPTPTPSPIPTPTPTLTPNQTPTPTLVITNKISPIPTTKKETPISETPDNLVQESPTEEPKDENKLSFSITANMIVAALMVIAGLILIFLFIWFLKKKAIKPKETKQEKTESKKEEVDKKDKELENKDEKSEEKDSKEDEEK